MKTHHVVSNEQFSWGAVTWLTAAVAILTVVADLSIANAQGGKNLRTVSHSRERMLELIEDYSNSIGLDDEASRSKRSNRRNSPTTNDVDTKAVHQLVRNLATKITNLAYALNDQSSQLPGLRKVYTETLRLSGKSTGILKRVDKFGVDGQTIDDLQQVDADWHEVAYHLEGIRGLSNESTELIGEISDLEKRIRQAIGITVQLDRRKLSIKVASLTADLDNLQSDVALELGQSQNIQFYRKSINRARQIAANLGSLLRDDQAENSEIIEEYEHFVTHWKPLVEKLQSEDDRFIDRGVHRIASASSDIHHLLLLPHTLDLHEFTILAKSLKKDVDQFFERTPLVLVIGLQHSKEALNAAERFHAACNKFFEAVNRGQDSDQIIDTFRAVEQTQRAFTDIYREVDSDRAIAVLNRINQDINAIRTGLQIPRDDFDDRSVEELAGSIQNFTEQIAIVCRRWLERDNQPNGDEWLREANGLADSAERLHDEIVSGRRLTDLKDEMADLYDRCRRVYAHLAKCQTEDRQVLLRISTHLTPAVTEMRSMILH